MKIAFWQIGKTKENYLKTGEEQYEKRLKHYLNFESKVYPDIKNAGKLNDEFTKFFDNSDLKFKSFIVKKIW